MKNYRQASFNYQQIPTLSVPLGGSCKHGTNFTEKVIVFLLPYKRGSLPVTLLAQPIESWAIEGGLLKCALQVQMPHPSMVSETCRWSVSETEPIL